MIKSLAPLAIFALLGASVIALPMFAPEVKAKEALALTKETLVLGKANQPAVDPVVADCSSQVWPNFDTSCLRESGSGNRVQGARLVTARR